MATRPAKKAAAKKAAVPAPTTKAAVPVVTLKAVFEQLGETHDLPKKQAHGLLADFVAAMTKHLQAGARIRMSGLGTLEVRARGARTGRNRRPARSSRSRPARKWRFVPPKNSSKRSRRRIVMLRCLLWLSRTIAAASQLRWCEVERQVQRADAPTELEAVPSGARLIVGAVIQRARLCSGFYVGFVSIRLVSYKTGISSFFADERAPRFGERLEGLIPWDRRNQLVIVPGRL
jgi:DNA-binding protein HU-beta